MSSASSAHVVTSLAKHPTTKRTFGKRSGPHARHSTRVTCGVSDRSGGASGALGHAAGGSIRSVTFGCALAAGAISAAAAPTRRTLPAELLEERLDLFSERFELPA